MMADYEYTFAVALQQKLKNKIQGAIHVCVVDTDELIVKITRNGVIDFKVSIPNFSNRILNGYTSDYAAYEIVNEYKKCLMKRYFY